MFVENYRAELVAFGKKLVETGLTKGTGGNLSLFDRRATHYMVAVAGPDVRVADYATYGTPELAHNAVKAMKGRRAVLLANHGMLAGANDLLNAFNIVEEVEYCAKVYCIAKSIGEPIVLSDEEMSLMHEKFKTYGQRKVRE